MSAAILPVKTNPLLNAALAYAQLGWHILPCWWVTEAGACACGKSDCKTPGKHPIHAIAPFGQKNATTDEALLKNWWARYPQANVAVYLEPSGLCGVDIDPRNGGLDTIDMLEAEHGPIYSDVLQYSGGGGEHRIFLKPADGGQLPGKLGQGVDLKLNGYLMLEPSNHESGQLYGWEASSDPRDGVIPSPLPDWMRNMATPRTSVEYDPADASGRFIRITPAQQQEILQALDAIPADDRDTWLQVGMALQSTGGDQWAFLTWDHWSQKSAKYDPVDQIRVWRSLKGRGLDGVTYKTIFELAKQQGVVVMPMPPIAAPVAVEPAMLERGEVADGVRIAQAEIIGTPPELLTPPGVLGVMAGWINATSYQPQPQFAVQAALAFASAVLGRRFTTTSQNWPPLYFLNIGKTGTGKEHAKAAIEQMLEACGLHHLIGPSGYTSLAGVHSALHEQPCHVAVVDEFHRVLEAATAHNSNQHGMVRTLIEVWGRADGILRPQGYSTVGMSKNDAKALADRMVINPSLTLLAMAVPDFWEKVGSAAARDGFLNRFLVVESDLGRRPMQDVTRTPVPEAIVNWVTDMRSRYTGLVDIDKVSNIAPDPVVMDFTPQALALLRDFDLERIALMNANDADGLADMFSRMREISMRISLIVALACGNSQIEEQDVRWAIQYARTYTMQTVAKLKAHLADSAFEAVKNQVMSLLLTAGGHGMTQREINRSSRKFRALPHRQQMEVLASLRAVEQAMEITTQPASGRGKPRTAWVATEYAPATYSGNNVNNADTRQTSREEEE